jgi:hypothetical protein
VSHTSLETDLTAIVDLDRIVATASYYTNGRARFGVLSHGTCFFPEVHDHGANADSVLDVLASSHLDFVVKEMDDRNYLVGFGEHAFGVVFQEETKLLEASPPPIRQAQDEVLATPPASPKGHLLIGLLARTRLLKDIAERRVVRVIKSSKS